MIRKYSASSARVEFERSVLEIERVIRQVAPPKRVDPDIKNYILGAAVLFLSAKLENYISDLFNGICQEACQKVKSAAGVPESLLGWAFLNDGHADRSRTFVARNDEGEFIRKTGEYLAREIIGNGSTYLLPHRFNGIDDKAYPSVKNVKRMFRRLGIDDVFSRLNRRMKCNAEGELTSFNNIRGALAHTGISGSYSYGDIKVQVARVRRLVGALDNEAFFHLRVCAADVAWKC